MDRSKTYFVFVLGRSAGELTFKDSSWGWFDLGDRHQFEAEASTLDIKKAIAAKYREYDNDVHFIVEGD